MSLANKYTYRVTWSEEDQEFVGLCTEFPSLSWLADNQGEALTGIIDVVGNVISDMQVSGEEIPSPLALRKYSGQFMVRTTPEVHRQLTIRSAEAGVSLNRYVNSCLSS